MHPQSTAIMGVYAITHVPSGRQYVGSSIDVPRRMREHVYRLEHTKRPPPLMRADWMRDGADAFVFEVLERVGDEADLERAERRWAARLKPIYNRLRPYRPSRRGKKAERAPRTHGYADWPSYFWSRMDRSGGFFTCWCWSGGLNACGYGTIRYKGRTWVAHYCGTAGSVSSETIRKYIEAQKGI